MLQDDAITCPGFDRAMRAAVEARPDRMITFFVGGNARGLIPEIYRAARNGRHWVEVAQQWCPAVALCWPVEMIRPLMEFVDVQRWPPSFRADDEIIGRYLRHVGKQAIATVPSLVDHPDDVVSLIGRRARHGLDDGRVAACWIGECDAATIDWAR